MTSSCLFWSNYSPTQGCLICEDLKAEKQQILTFEFFYNPQQKIGYSLWLLSFLISDPFQVLDQASQTQSALKATSNRLTRDMQNHLMSIKLLNQSLERYLDRVEGWKDVIEETEEKMKTLTEDQYDIKATAQQVNMTVALRWLKRCREQTDGPKLFDLYFIYLDTHNDCVWRMNSALLWQQALQVHLQFWKSTINYKCGHSHE